MIGRGYILDKMKDVTGGSVIRVKYNSRRSEEKKVMEGKIVHMIVRISHCAIKFVRDDGQICIVKGDGKLYSQGSKFPVTGEITEIEIKNGR